jgi:hypothetical protein
MPPKLLLSETTELVVCAVVPRGLLNELGAKTREFLAGDRARRLETINLIRSAEPDLAHRAR